MGRKLLVAIVAALALPALSAAAHAPKHAKLGTKLTKPTARASAANAPSTLTVGKQSDSCPSPDFLRIRDAIRAAHAGDTISICAGTYAEGPGTPGTTVLTINKDLTLRGAGADQVTIEPTSGGAKRIVPAHPDLRDGHGVIIAIVGQKQNR